MKILIKLTPLEPFFFGNERTFAYGDAGRQKAESYYIVSDDLPSQTTLFGVLRYLGIKEKKSDYSLSKYDIDNIGEESFDLTKEKQNFGRIAGISPLYLVDEDNRFYIKTPFNNKSEKEYKPFTEYDEIKTSVGMKLLPIDYSAKTYNPNSFICLSDGKVITNVFDSFEKVGINTTRKDNAYFKKRYKLLNGYSFSFFAEVKKGFPEIDNQVVFLGQGKSAFLAEVLKDIAEPDNRVINEKLKNHRYPIAIAVSDIYIKQDDINQLYKWCKFAIVSNKGYRPFSTNYNKGTTQINLFRKSEKYINLIEAGSVFLIDDMNNFKAAIENTHAQKAGFNNVFIGGKWYDSSSI